MLVFLTVLPGYFYLHFFNNVKLNVTLFWKNNDNDDDDDHDDGDDENDDGDDDEDDNENDDDDADDDNIRLKRWPKTTLYPWLHACWKNKKGKYRKQPLQQYPFLNTPGTNHDATDQKNRPARKTMTTGQLSISRTLL